MKQRITRSALAVISIAVSAAVAFGQASPSAERPLLNPSNTWEGALTAAASHQKILVVTVDHPDRRRGCRLKSFTSEELVCSRSMGAPRTYRRDQVVALILPGDAGERLPLLLGANGALGAAIWGTVVLAAACPPCAAATAFAALYLFVGAGFVLLGDGQPDRLLYRASGEELNRRPGLVEN
jgi:hypothetical protein